MLIGGSVNGLCGQTSAATKLADGTAIRLTLKEALSSATAQSGQVVHLEVADDIRSGTVVVIPRGTPAEGHVVTAERKKRMGRGGRLDLAVDYIHLADGTNLKICATANHEGGDKTGTVIAGTLLVSPLFLLMHGKDVKIPSGTELTAFLDSEYTVPSGAQLKSSTTLRPSPTATENLMHGGAIQPSEESPKAS